MILLCWRTDLQKRLSGMPLGRIYGRRNFYGLEFTLSSGTLEPRADTEVLIDRALDLYRSTPPVRILDLGTGTGCILLTLLKHWPKSEGVGVDIAHDALETARRNASYHKLTERVSFIEGNWGEGLAGGFDLVVSNPPYIERDVIKSLPDEVRLHDPILALDGGTDGMDAYKVIFSQLPVLLKPEGRALFEIGYDQSRKIERLAEDHGFKVEAIHPDSAGRARVAEVLRRA
ncbi:MAG: peptide chain release factor N(5)-glutamine methyltransferase [Alphaproteobacteria bacterium]|nr:peptide chain release factor N(5)-glutamine methyltransferase [Alphaproteobacteria bacterium]